MDRGCARDQALDQRLSTEAARVRARPAVAEFRDEPRRERVLGPEVEAEPRDMSECGDGRELVRGRPLRRPSGPEVVADSIVLESVGI